MFDYSHKSEFNFYFRMEARGLRNACAEDREVRKVCPTHPTTSEGSPEGKVLHVHTKHLEEVLPTSVQSQHGRRQFQSVGEEDHHRDDVQQLPLQELRDTAGKRNSLHQHLPYGLGESDESDCGNQHRLTRQCSLPDLRKPDEVRKALQRSPEGI